jgi:hypothetical protein
MKSSNHSREPEYAVTNNAPKVGDSAKTAHYDVVAKKQVFSYVTENVVLHTGCRADECIATLSIMRGVKCNHTMAQIFFVCRDRRIPSAELTPRMVQKQSSM